MQVWMRGEVDATDKATLMHIWHDTWQARTSPYYKGELMYDTTVYNLGVRGEALYGDINTSHKPLYAE